MTVDATTGSILIAGVTGGVSTLCTVAAMRAHVRLLEQRLNRMQSWIEKIEIRLETTRDKLLGS